MNDSKPSAQTDLSDGIRDRIKELRRVRARDLVANPKNWRRHPQSQVDALRGVLAEIGYADALLARELPDGRLMLIDGHLRAATSPELELPVLVLDLTAEEADKLLLTLDPLAAMAESDSERLKALLATVRSNSPAVEELLKGIAGERLWEILHPEDAPEFESSPERAEELRKKWRTAVGQLWQAGPHRIICGDSRSEAVLTKLLAGAQLRVRMVWTDPPYGVSYGKKNQGLNAADRGNRIQRRIVNDQAPSEAPAVFTAALRLVVAHAENGASCYATIPPGSLLAKFIAAFDASGFSFKHSLVWVKNHFVLGRSDYHSRHEHILYGWLENGPHYFTQDRTQSSVFEFDKPRVSETHPTIKPVALIAKMIANSSRPGELVYDPFAGSASTILAAHQLRRIACACELDPVYVAVALERLSALGLRPALVVE